MRKITLACLQRDRQTAIDRLQALGTVHIANGAPGSSREFRRLVHLQGLLSNVKAAMDALPQGIEPEPSAKLEPVVALAKAQKMIAAMEKTEARVEECKKAIEQLKPWGSFSGDLLKALARKGLYIKLCIVPGKKLPEMPEDTVAKVISESDGITYFAVFSSKPIEEGLFTPAPLPENKGLHQWEAKLYKAYEQLKAQQSALAGFAIANRESLEEENRKIQEMKFSVQARDGMEQEGHFAFLKGYVPAAKVEELHRAALENLWVVEDKDVEDDDMDAPTKLNIPRPFRMARHIFDFVGILPGYHETDVSVVMLIFLSIFCGMLVGDAGYGLIFLAVTGYFRLKAKSENAKDGLNLLMVMSGAILIFGALSGNWFAIPAEKMPGPLGGLPWLSKHNAQQHVQLLCFFIAAFHMSLASVWRALQEASKANLKEDDTRKFLKCIFAALGKMGWAVFLWANFGLVKLLIVDGGGIGDLSKPYIWLYGIGFVLILAFDINWKDMGTVIYMPFSFINSFVDVLSYIRLFAVGLSSVYIANSFNSMAMSVSEGNPWLIPVSMLVLALGHALNIALACMGVLVHGIRLNTLEFSGHMDLSWTGKPYKPFSNVR
ncbi:MAG: hypothetical protein IKS20_04585 [Victivallales bacterium]|nr:hypothetical protein [Victivallales bacterium]